MLTVMLASIVLSACGGSGDAAAANASKSKLDHELTHASHDLGVPASLLAPIQSQEQQAASGSGWLTYDYTAAAKRYDALYTQLLSVEQQSADTLRQQTQNDIQTMTGALNQRRAQGFDEASYYQTRLNTAINNLQTATTPGQIAAIDADIQAQTAALNAMWPAYQKLQDYKSMLTTLRGAGVNVGLSQQQLAQDAQAFQNASSAGSYQTLQKVIDGQVMQIMADQTAALPYVGSSMLQAFQARIDILRQFGETDAATTLQQQHDADAKRLASAHSLGDYLALGQTINQQTDAMALPLARGQAKHDLQTLLALIAHGKTIRIGGYASDYEYADQERGYGDAQNEVQQAQTLDDYLTADNDVNILTANLRAMLDNLNDPTAHNQPHATDLQLMQRYGAMTGRVIVVSLREQTARLYDNGQLVYTSNVTTGRPEKPSPPGLHYAMYKQTHMMFTSPDPAGSPFWYAPTPINYGILYANYGFFLHDAWWRRRFGPGSNLPHYDPAAFNGGSHGCINFQENTMAWVYNWTPVGSPIIVY
jgi:hypothetical protein